MAEPKRILVVEDDIDAREVIITAIESSFPDIETAQAATRDEALANIKGPNNLDGVITDLRVPKSGDGEAIIEAALQKGLRVIVISGTIDDLSEEVKKKCIAVFLKGGTRMADLKKAIRCMLQK